ncbi:unnamed protein product [Symbiodinium sp. CCMP2592]|nr:unnamed protein product [Symbiodinium sp. CCMP2592]
MRLSTTDFVLTCATSGWMRCLWNILGLLGSLVAADAAGPRLASIVPVLEPPKARVPVIDVGVEGVDMSTSTRASTVALIVVSARNTPQLYLDGLWAKIGT